jgi:hypothetical protein
MPSVLYFFQWHLPILDLVRRAGKADKYPTTKLGLLALEKLDLSRCKLTGERDLFFSPLDLCVPTFYPIKLK